MPKIEVFEVRGTAIDRVRWDDWAQRAGASIRSSYSHSMAWSIKHRFTSRLRRFELYIDEDGFPRKIGQFLLGESKLERVFLDRLQLIEPANDIWVPAMAAILAKLGAGRYRYGWELNIEQSREGDLSLIPGVTISSVRPIVVEAVDFSRWSSWDEYHRATSNNIRRNAKKAMNEFPDIRTEVRRGLGSVVQIRDLINLRAEMYKRKGIGFQGAKAAINALGNLLSSPNYVFTALVKGAGATLAAFTGSSFGAQTTYTEGGSREENSGAAWYLMIAMLQRAYERSPDGKFVMGYIDHAIHDESVGGGLLRSRRSCRVTDYETSIIYFRWDAARDS